MSSTASDQIRRWANLILAIAQIAVTYLCFALNVSFAQATGTVHTPDPPIVPAEYAFIIWSVIYAGSLAYGIYQFAPSRKSDRLLRRVGWFTASGFLGCCVWLIMVRTGHLIWTVPTIYWMAASLFAAFHVTWQLKAADKLVRWCVIAPISVYSGWLSVAIFANTSSEFAQTVLGSTAGTIALIAAAAGLASWFLRRSNGNLYYGATIGWALIGIGVRDQFELKNIPVAVTAWTCLVVFGTMFAIMRRLSLHQLTVPRA